MKASTTASRSVSAMGPVWRSGLLRFPRLHEAANDTRERLDYAVRLVPDMSAREPQTLQSGDGVGVITPMVNRLLHRCAVVPESIGLDDETEIGPKEVHAVAVDPLLRQWDRQTSLSDEAQESSFEFGVSETKRVPVKRPPQDAQPGAARELIKARSERLGIDEVKLVSLIDCRFELVYWQNCCEVYERADGACDRDPIVDGDVLIGEVRATTKSDALRVPSD